jgi:transcriptional regulator with XRE-family HTH domain
VNSPQEIARKRIRELRRRHDWSQQDLADALGRLGMPVDRATVARVELGERGLSLDEAFEYALALDVAPVSLFLPLGGDDVRLASGVVVPAPRARRWLIGQEPLEGQDARYWLHELPEEAMLAAVDSARRWQPEHPEVHREVKWTEDKP